MTKMTREERKLFDAQADHEAWSLAHEILEPWVRTTKPIGSDELTQVMEKALAHVEMEPNRTRDVLGSLQAGMAPLEYVVSELARSRGLAGLEELKERLRAAGYDNTADKLLEGPPGGWRGRARQRDPVVDGRGAGAHRLGLCADIFLS